MFHFNRALFFSLISLFLAGALVFAPLGAGQGQKKSQSDSPGQEKKRDQGIDDDEEDVANLDDDEGAKDQNDPCDKLIDHPGQAKGLEKQCARGGGSSGIAKGDYNGDGIGDLAVGVPSEDIDDKSGAGAVNVTYGSADGLCATGPCTVIGAQVWSQDEPGVPDISESHDLFGSALAAGDFNGDGCSDLAIGVSGEDINANTGHPVEFRRVNQAGAVIVIYGSDVGLVAVGAGNAQCKGRLGVPVPGFYSFEDLMVASPNTVKDQYKFRPSDNDYFGSALAWGDFDEDGIGDLAVGIPYWDLQQDSMLCYPIIKDAGAVAVFEGDPGGLKRRGDLWTQHGKALVTGDDEAITRFKFCANGDFDILSNTFFSFETVVGIACCFDIKGSPEENDHFGETLAAGDFDGKGGTDLAIGVLGENIAGATNAGAVNVIYGDDGLESPGNQFWSQGESGIKGTLESNDGFGVALAAGDFDGNGCDDLAVGVSHEKIGSLDGTGGVNIFYGSNDGLTDVGDQFFDENNLFVTPDAQTNAAFGLALAAGDFDGDGAKDLAIGAPFRNVVKQGTTRVDAGRVVIVYGGVGVGLRPATTQFVAQGLGLLNGTVAGDPETATNLDGA